jgi:hypothetical protein
MLQYFGAQPSNPRHHNGAALGKFNDFLQVVFGEALGAREVPPELKKRAGGRVSNCYKVCGSKYLQSEMYNCFELDYDYIIDYVID